MSKRVLIITGPTASGKTVLGFKLARALNGRIISADSRSVYQELTIGAAKPTLDATEIKTEESDEGKITWIDGVAHYLIDVVTLDDIFTAYDFVRQSINTINRLHEQDILPIIVGGTGFYIEALRQGYQFLDSANQELEQISKLNFEAQVKRLQRLDPISAAKIDLENPIKVARALAFVQKTGQSFWQAQSKTKPSWQFKTFLINRPRTELYERIDQGVEERLKMGLINEVQDLINRGYGDRLIKLGLEYRFITEYLLEGEQTQDRFIRKIQELKWAIHAFARRQLIWWRKRENVIWSDDVDMLEKELLKY